MRARNIKPSFFMNEDLGALDAECRLLFVGLWCLADREGFLEYRPKRIRAEIFPYNQTFDTKLCPWLSTLAKVGLIGLWSDNHDNVVAIEVVNFLKHQRPHRNEKASEIKPLVDTSALGPSKDCPFLPERGKRKEERGTYSPEQKKLAQGPAGEPLFSIPLNRKDTEFKIYQEDVDEWQETFQGVDVVSVLKRARQWNIDNPKRRKTKSGIRNHLTTWLGKEQNKSNGNGGGLVVALNGDCKECQYHNKGKCPNLIKEGYPEKCTSFSRIVQPYRR